MKWMLVIMVFGAAPVETGMLFDSLDDCLKAEESVRAEYAMAFNKWLTWARANPTVSGFPGSQEFAQKRIGLNNSATCVPRAVKQQ